MEATSNNDEINRNESRLCWLCKKTEDQEINAAVQWTKPCKCEGIFRWIHQSCLQIWIDVSQDGNSFRRVGCFFCGTDYIIDLPRMGILYDVLEFIDVLTRLSYPILAAVFLAPALYLASYLYGDLTVRQVLGDQIDLTKFSEFHIVALPAIPLCLLLGRLIRWQDHIIRILQYYQILLPIDNNNGDNDNDRVVGRTSIFDKILKVENFSVLLLPSVSSVVGHIFFSYISNNFYRTLLGGLTFIAVYVSFKIYMKMNQSMKKKRRKVIDYTDENIRRYQRNTD